MELNNLNDDFIDLDSISEIGENDNFNNNNNFNEIPQNFNNNCSILSSINSSEYNESQNQSNDEIIINTEIIKKRNKKRNKDELNLTPLPIFSCIYCSNDKVAFSHLSREILSEKYLFQTSNYDIQELEKIINDSLIEKECEEDKLIKLIIEYSEYIKKNYLIEEIKNFLMSDYYKLLCINNEKIIQNSFVNKLELSINRRKNEQILKGIHIPKNSTKSLFNTTNSLVNNIVALCPETNINTNKNISNISDSNFNSLSLNYDNTAGNNNNIKMLNVYSIGMDSIVENIGNDSSEENEEDNDFLKIFRFDLRRKINHNDIIWDNNYFDIWNPKFNDDENIENNLINKSDKDFTYFEKRLLKNKGTSSLLINHQYYDDSQKIKQNIFPANKQIYNKNLVKNQNLEKLFIEKFDNVERRNKSNFFENSYYTNKTISKIKEYVNELNSKNQGSTQSDSKILNFSNNRNSFLDKNRGGSFLNQNSFNLNSLLHQNLSQNYPSRLRKIEQIHKIKSNMKKNDRIKKKVDDLIDIINIPCIKKFYQKNDNTKINSILSTTFQKINIKTKKSKYNSIIGSSFFDN
jgi:hypothetical protein